PPPAPAAPAGQPVVQGSGEPLADALSAALGQVTPVTASQPAGQSRSEQVPAGTTEGRRGVTNAPESAGADPLADVLRGIEGVN
ncbi:MAG TPA: hypothetical protein PJ999_15505, partial [Paracoccus sp. (in: a-proteobacteria)]|nr:hypothetical protein [Paracoccus sp. (in: a-proteobacteria)]